MTSLVPRDDRPPVPAMPDWGQLFASAVSDAEYGAEAVEAVGAFLTNTVAPLLRGVRAHFPPPRPCPVCTVETRRWPDMERARHWRRHSLPARVSAVGWRKALMMS